MLKVPIVVKFINEFIVLISTTVNKSLRLVKDDSETAGKARGPFLESPDN